MSTEERKIQLVAEVDGSKARQGFTGIKDDARDMAQSVAQAGQQAGKGVDNIGESAQKVGAALDDAGKKGGKGLDALGDGAEIAAKKVDRASTSMVASVQRATAQSGGGKQRSKPLDDIGDSADEAAKKVARATKNIESSIQRAIAQAEATAAGGGQRAMFESLAKQRGADVTALKPYLDQLDAVSKKQVETGMSAAAMQNALRGVPAQFTDIAVSLASGQRPLMVLLQQGGQLKDMFGGAGAAAKALGGYVMSLVNPYTLTAAAAAGLVAIYESGRGESEAFRESLIRSGNAAGATVSQMNAAAVAVTKIAGGTRGGAADAIAALAATGKVAAENLERTGAAVAAMNRVDGTAVDKLAEKYAGLAKEPLAAILKLNEESNFLTVAVYRQIKSLEDQGRVTEAAALAQRTYADASKQMADELEANLGGIQKLWHAVANEAKSAWDIMLNVGREDTLPEQLSKAEKAAQALRDRLAAMQRGGAGDSLFGQFLFGQLSAADADVARLREKIAAEKSVSAEKAKQAELTKANAAWDKEGEKYLGKKAELWREITKAEIEWVATGRSEAELAERIKQIQAKYADKKTKDQPIGPDSIALGKAYGDTYERLNKLIVDATGKTRDLNAAEKLRLDLVTAGDWDRMPEAWRQMLDAKIKDTAATIENAEVQKLLNHAHLEARAAFEKEMDSLDKKIAGSELELAQIGKVAALKHEAAAVSYDMAAALEAEAASNYEANDAWKDAARSIELATKYRRLAELERSKGAAEASAGAAKDAERVADRFADDIRRSATDALYHGLEKGGKEGALVARDAIINTLKAIPLKLTVEAVVNPVMDAARGALGSASNSVLDNVSGIGNFANGIGSLASSWNGAGLASFAGSSLGQSLGLSNGLQGPMANGSNLGLTASGQALSSLPIGGMMTAYQVGGVKGFAAGTASTAIAGGVGSMVAGGSFMSGASAALMNLGPYGWAALAVMAIVGSMGKPGGPKVEGNFSDMVNSGMPSYAKDGPLVTAAEQLTKGVEESYRSIVSLFGRVPSDLTGGAFISRDPAGTAQTQLDQSVFIGGNQVYRRSDMFGGAENAGRSDDELQNALTQSSGLAVIAALEATEGLPKIVETYLDSLKGVKLTTEEVATALNKVKVLGEIGKAMDSLGLKSDELTEALVNNFGGLDGVAAGLSTYYENFYSGTEKQKRGLELLGEELSRFGVTMPEATNVTREWYRAQVENKDLTVEQRAALIQLNPVFASLVPATEDLSRASADLLKSLKDDSKSLTVDLLKAQGRTAEATALITAGYSAEARAAYDANEAIRARIKALDDEKQATENKTALLSKFAGPLTPSTAAAQFDAAGVKLDLPALLGMTPAALSKLAHDTIAALDPATESGRAWLKTAEKLAPAWDAITAAAQTSEQALMRWRNSIGGIMQSLGTLHGDDSLETNLAIAQANADNALAALNEAAAAAYQSIRTLTLDDLRDPTYYQPGNIFSQISPELQGLVTAALESAAGVVTAQSAIKNATADAATKAAADAAKAAEDAAHVNDNRRQLALSIAQIKDDPAAIAAATKAIRDATLTTLDPTLQALQTELWGLQDAADAAAKSLKLQNDTLALQAQIAGLNGDVVAAAAVKERQRAAELAAVDPALRSLTTELWALQDAADAAASAAKRAADVQSAGQSLNGALQAIRDKAASSQAAVDAARINITNGYLAAQQRVNDLLRQGALEMKGFATNIHDFVRSLSQNTGDGAKDFAALQADFAISAAKAKAGDKEALAGIVGKAQALDSAYMERSASAEDYARMRAGLGRTMNEIAKLADGRAGALGEAVDPLVAAQADLALWTKAAADSGAATTAAIVDYATDWRKADAANLVAQQELTSALQMLADNGINQAVIDNTLISTLQALMTLITSFNGARVAADPIASSLQTAYGKGNAAIVADAAGAAAGYAVKTNPGTAQAGTVVLTPSGLVALGIEASWSPDQVAAQVANNMHAFAPGSEQSLTLAEWAKKNKIPGFLSGINEVPHDMLAVIHKGEGVLPPYDNRAFMASLRDPGAGNAALLEEVRGLRIEVANLKAGITVIATNAIGTKAVLKKWDVDGLPETRESEALES